MEPSPLGVAELLPGLGEPAREECGGSTQMTHPESKCKLTLSHPYVCAVQDPSAPWVARLTLRASSETEIFFEP